MEAPPRGGGPSLEGVQPGGSGSIRVAGNDTLSTLVLPHTSSPTWAGCHDFTSLFVCPSSATRFALILKLSSDIYKLVQSDSYATKKSCYNDPQLFGSQRTLDSIVDGVSCMLKVPRRSLHVIRACLATSKGFISGDLCYLEEDGTKVDCSSSSTVFLVSSNVNGIRSILPVYFNHVIK
ncbi:meiotic recombination protein SPO11-like [Sinocyclocheilus anshuiensis]|uniref:meiotic recombination protein SPO11-like n=1 Tax=Sinocyclocheilus anshuiensis TaxID=1608454 RepID=UPI0007BA1146|nr:PREDICTED: meiotic recombination protein SPO11-like [Sinocyclocheilus anshuiensis]